MTTQTLTNADLETLEAIVDRASIYRVLAMLAEICEAKAEHLASNWQDAASARQWSARGNRIERLAESVNRMYPE